MHDFNHVFKQVHKDAKTSHLKPLYMLIKVDVDPEIVYNNPKAHTYAENHCNSLEYELVDWFYPNEMHEPCYPFIKL
jgi:hypothetical protein